MMTSDVLILEILAASVRLSKAAASDTQKRKEHLRELEKLAARLYISVGAELEDLQDVA